MAVRKQSGDRASSIASWWMNLIQRYPGRGDVWISRSELKVLCASVLSQDEQKGKRKVAPRRKTKRSKYLRRGPNNSD